MIMGVVALLATMLVILESRESCILGKRGVAGRKSKELYYVPGVSSREGGLRWGSRREPGVRGLYSPLVAGCALRVGTR